MRRCSRGDFDACVGGVQETRRAFARKIASAKDPELLVPYYAKLLSGQRESMLQYTTYKENTTTVNGKQIRMGYVCYSGDLAKVSSLGACRRSCSCSCSSSYMHSNRT